jgi:methionyl-tRNA formyltransferase
MKIVFFGTSSFAAHILQFLVNQREDLAAVVTRPDRPKGRSLKVSSSPVKETLLKLDVSIPLLQPEKASTAEVAEVLKAYAPDLFIVVAFGEIIKQNLLSIPKYGSINIHTSLLPKYRGAAPIQRCLMNGERETGITLIDMVLEMDAGDILKMVKLPLSEEMTFGDVEEKLCSLACTSLKELLAEFKTGAVKRYPQNPSDVTFAPKITPEDERIHWDKDAAKVHHLIQALSPTPGAWCLISIDGEKKRLKIKRSCLERTNRGRPGEILTFDKEGWVVACGAGALRLLEVQLEGKKTMKGEDFVRGYQKSLLILS